MDVYCEDEASKPVSAAEDLVVPFAGPTFVNSWTLPAYMGDAIMRHPQVRVTSLRWFGSPGLAPAVKHYTEFVHREVGPRRPYVAVGHSQGGVVAALHALTDPHAQHVVMLGAPLNGAWLSRLLLVFPTARELLAGSSLLTDLQRAMLEQPHRFTSIFCPQEQLMHSTSPYLPGITNLLVGSVQQLSRFAVDHPDVRVDEQIVASRPVTHTSAMRNPDFRAALWRVISREADAAGLAFA